MDGEKLKTARTKALMTLRDLEEASGVPFLTIHRIEAGKVKKARPSTAKRLATALKIDPLELMSEAQLLAGVAVLTNRAQEGVGE